jgi:hypothetical protein
LISLTYPAHESSDPAALAEIEYDPGAPEDPQQKIAFITRNQSAMGSARDTVVPFAFDKVMSDTSARELSSESPKLTLLADIARFSNRPPIREPSSRRFPCSLSPCAMGTT